MLVLRISFPKQEKIMKNRIKKLTFFNFAHFPDYIDYSKQISIDNVPVIAPLRNLMSRYTLTYPTWEPQKILLIMYTLP